MVARGLKVTMQKLDPYLNVDPGTMNPFQHGEVFVTEDGAETDLDIGHYERFLDVNLGSEANVTTGKVYSTVIAKERRGDYLGDTVQVIPHITNQIKSDMMAMAYNDTDIVIHEIGGTVGDIESLPFLEAARQVRREVGRENCMFLHVSLVPYLAPASELKTKPTQHSVAQLRQVGITPDSIVCRSDREIPDNIKRKISLMCDVEEESVVSCPDAPSIYDIPRVLHTQGLDAYAVRRLDVSFRDVDWSRWDDLTDRVHHPSENVTIAVVGKYIDLPDAYLSASEALRAGGFANRASVSIRWVAADECHKPDRARELLHDVDGICVPGGFGGRGVEGKLGALRFAREQKIPALGLSLGLQCMVIEAARNLLGWEDAASTEFAPDSTRPVITTPSESGSETGRKAGMRLGAYPVDLAAGSLTAGLYQTLRVSERHRNRYEVNLDHVDELATVGLRVSGTSPDGTLVEFMELDPDLHPFYVGSQGHPEFRSRPTNPHPLFVGFVRAAVERTQSQRLFAGETT